MMLSHHTSKKRGTYTYEHGTPNGIINVVRESIGGHAGIDLDLASNKAFNETVMAINYYDRERPCPYDPPLEGVDSIWCNPPGPRAKVCRFWLTWLNCIKRKPKIRAGFLLFNIEHQWSLLDPSLVIHAGDLARLEYYLLGRVSYVGSSSNAPFSSGLYLYNGLNSLSWALPIRMYRIA